MLRGWALPRSAGGDALEEFATIIAPHLGRRPERAESEEMAGNVLAVESILMRWKSRRLDRIAAASARLEDTADLTSTPGRGRSKPTKER
ncbi:MAG: hypothetical protein Q8P18_05835 [Pseudomonadota bacterium]|nr:hypothetical protein [Pseudomonadota bacterium]